MSTTPHATSQQDDLTPALLVQAYCQGYFPMAESRDGPLFWLSPDPRAVLPLEAFHIPRGLRRRLKKDDFVITRDQAFEQVIQKCAEQTRTRPDTWISDEIVAAYTELHRNGLAHSVEAWRKPSAGGQPELVGGLYGVSLRGAYFGESMFSRATDASKVCLVHLVEHMIARGMTLLDVQFTNPHLEQFGIQEISRDHYLLELQSALSLDVSW